MKNNSQTSSRHSTDRTSWTILIVFTLGVLIFLIYFNSLRNHFTNWDDGMIYQNSTIRNLNWMGIKRIFKYEKGNTYQPIRMLSYAVDYHFWKLNPMGYRITNIIFYILTCFMVFLTTKLLSKYLREGSDEPSHERVALFGSFLFAAHPVHVEAVTWLAARKEVLQGFFFFLAFYLYLRGREEGGRRKFFYLSLVLFTILLASLSKPSAVVFPGVILFFEIAYRKNEWVDFIKRHWLFFLISSVISAIFIFILIKVMFEAGGFKPYRGGNFFNNFLISFYAFLYNIKLLALTINYSASYTIPMPNPIMGLRTIVFIGAFFLMAGLSLWSLRKTKVFFFSFFFFFVTLLPYLNILPISTLLADRYVFIASFSYCFLLGIAFNKLYELRDQRFSKDFPRLLTTALFICLLIGYSFMTYKQNRVWENSYTLWADAVEKAPESNTANAMMGVVYMELGMDEEAVGYLEKAVQILPYDYLSRNNLGIVYERLNQPQRALEEFLKAIWLRPDDETIQLNLSLFYQRQKAYEKAEEILKTILLRREKDAILHFRLGVLYKEAGRYQEAISEIERSMNLAPNVVNPYEELGDIYLSRLNDKKTAKYYYSKGVEAAKKSSPRVEGLRWMIQDLECH